MNPTKIEWADFTWNPVTGCTRGCHYCYARRMAYRLRGRYGYDQEQPFKPKFHVNRLLEPHEIKRSSKIFTCSMGELFDPEIPNICRALVLEVMEWNPQHEFLVLTKQLENMMDFFYHTQDIPNNLWIGISQDGKTTDGNEVEYFRNLELPRKIVSFEPLLGPINQNLHGLKWVIIGAQTGSSAKPPEKEWVQEIIDEADSWDIPVFLKDNLHWPQKRQEWPEQLEVYKFD